MNEIKAQVSMNNIMNGQMRKKNGILMRITFTAKTKLLPFRQRKNISMCIIRRDVKRI